MSRILVVDDEKIPCRLLSRFLSGRGYEVRSAMMADEAIELVASFRPRILLVDWLLKEDKNGLHVAEALRRRDKSAGIIFLTGLPTDRVAAQAVTVSPFEVMEKPCDFTLLMKTVEEMLQPDSVKP